VCALYGLVALFWRHYYRRLLCLVLALFPEAESAIAAPPLRNATNCQSTKYHGSGFSGRSLLKTLFASNVSDVRLCYISSLRLHQPMHLALHYLSPLLLNHQFLNGRLFNCFEVQIVGAEKQRASGGRVGTDMFWAEERQYDSSAAHAGLSRRDKSTCS
jgi:hypothetical protein